jgi:uncharacterized membrane protein YecN with MAPEG domain
MLLHVSLLYGGLSVLLVTLLGGNVSRLRGKHKALAGATLPREMVGPHRAHGNATEWVPLWLALLVALELSGRVTPFWLHLLAGTFLGARVLHAAGFYRRSNLVAVGAGLTYLVMLVMGGWAVTLGLMHG